MLQKPLHRISWGCSLVVFITDFLTTSWAVSECTLENILKVPSLVDVSQSFVELPSKKFFLLRWIIKWADELSLYFRHTQLFVFLLVIDLSLIFGNSTLAFQMGVLCSSGRNKSRDKPTKYKSIKRQILTKSMDFYTPSRTKPCRTS